MKCKCWYCKSRQYIFKVICYPFDNVYELFPVICDKCKDGYILFGDWLKCWLKGIFKGKRREG
jgi:hypothetical protein